MRAWFSGRTRPCQGRDASSILGARTLDFYTVLDVCNLCKTVDNIGDTGYKT